MTTTPRRTGRVLSSDIDALDWEAVIARLAGWGRAHESRVVAVCNVHVVVEASRDVAYGRLINESDMAVPDGAPIAWMLRRLGFAGQPRVSGPDLTWALCGLAEAEGLAVVFYGSTPETLARLEEALAKAFPRLRVHTESPPFRALTEAEDAEVVERLNASGAAFVFVGLGCPKQERWMAVHRGRVNAVLLGVGAAFDFHAGVVSRAPKWMRDNGLEWLHRLISEPRRLWKRYLVTNTLFLLRAGGQLIRRQRPKTGAR